MLILHSLLEVIFFTVQLRTANVPFSFQSTDIPTLVSCILSTHSTTELRAQPLMWRSFFYLDLELNQWHHAC